jgi:hypothetical protein
VRFPYVPSTKREGRLRVVLTPSLNPGERPIFALLRLPTVGTPKAVAGQAHDWILTSTKSVVISSKAALKDISLKMRQAGLAVQSG